MLEFFRKYQRSFFLFITVLLIASFSVFGAVSTFLETQEPSDIELGKMVDGSKMYLSEVRRLSRFLATDAEMALPGETLNLCNDGVLRKEFLATGVSQSLVEAYFPYLQEGLEARLKKAKRYQPYVHPEAAYFSAQNLWDRFLPKMGETLSRLQKEEKATPAVFADFCKLYELQNAFPPELLRRFLIGQAQQMNWVRPDPFLQTQDMSLFGFHSLNDWFGPYFLDLHAQFILNGAKEAEKNGHQVSLEEAKGDLLSNFQRALKVHQKQNPDLKISFSDHLKSLGFTEKSAAETWRWVLLFRREFKEVAEAVLLDPIPLQEFASYASETLKLDHYHWDPSLVFADLASWAEFELYLAAVSPSQSFDGPPDLFYSVQEVDQKFPDLVRTSYQAKITQVSKEEIALRAPLKEIALWQNEEQNRDLIRQKFPELSKDFQIDALDPQMRTKLDAWTRLRLLEKHPEWVDEELGFFASNQKNFSLSRVSCSLSSIKEPTRLQELLNAALLGDEEAAQLLSHYTDDGSTFFRFENIETKQGPSILSFKEAKEGGYLKKELEKRLQAAYAQVKKGEAKPPFIDEAGKWKPLQEVKEALIRNEFAATIRSLEKKSDRPLLESRLWQWTEKARSALLQEPASFETLSQGIFPLYRTEEEILRKGREKWKIEEGFAMEPQTWSSIHSFPKEAPSFFFLKEKCTSKEPMHSLTQIAKQQISADLQRSLAKQLIEKIQKTGSIVIPEEPKP